MKSDKTIHQQSNEFSPYKMALVFLKMGALSFGGWSTTVVLLEKELGRTLPEATSVDLKGAASHAQILPGATQVAIVSNVGYQLRGIKGALIATISYLLPAISLMTLFAWLYFGYMHQPDIQKYLDGLIPALAGIILANAFRIGNKHVTHPVMWGFVIIACLLLLVFKIHALIIIFAYGIISLLFSVYKAKKGSV
jgi:chromate transporter